MTPPGEIMGRTPEVPDHTHGRVEEAVLAHAGLREQQWSQYRFGRQDDVVWEATTLYGNVGGRTRGCIFAMLPADKVNPARTFYLNSGGQPLVEGGRNFWQWTDAMNPDDKEAVAALSVPEMDMLLELLHIGRYHSGDISEVWDEDEPRPVRVLRVVRGTEPRLRQTETGEIDGTVTSLLGRLADRGNSGNGHDKPGA